MEKNIMMYKKIMIITIILTCLLAVSAVSATENATDDIVCVDDSNNNDLNIGVSSGALQEDAATKTIENSDLEKLEISNNELNSNSNIEYVDVLRNGDYELTVDAIVDGDSVDITVKLPNSISNPILIDVNGVGYYANATGGEAKLHLNDLPKGKYDVIATYPGDIYYSPRSDTVEFVISNSTLAVQVIAQNVTAGENSLFIIDTIDKFNGNVSIKVEDKVLYNGSVKLLIAADKLTEGDKTATFVFYGDGRYDELAVDNVKFTVSKPKTQLIENTVVKKANPKLTAKSKTFKRSDKYKKYIVTLKNNQNKAIYKAKVYIKVNKKTYSATVNKKGVATFKLTKLTKKGKYSAVVTYKGNENYNAATKNKIKIAVK